MSTKTEKTIAKRKADAAKRMHIASIGGKFHVLEIPATDGAPFDVWGPFDTKLGVEFFLEELLRAHADGKSEEISHWGSTPLFEQAADVLKFLEKRESIVDPRALALDLCKTKPWNLRSDLDDDLPF